MIHLIAILSFISGSWQTIYLYGLFATDSAEYSHGLVVFPLVSFLILGYCWYENNRKYLTKTEE